jgi:signal transduction histidine kinase
MVAALNGTILARNLPQRGTIFSIEIPSTALHKA